MSEFRPGYIFGSRANSKTPKNRRKLKKLLSEFRKSDRQTGFLQEAVADSPEIKPIAGALYSGSWGVYDTPLSEYASISIRQKVKNDKGAGIEFDKRGLDLEKLLEQKIEASPTTVQVLDMGVGSARQWKDWLDRLDLHAMSLTRSIDPKLAKKIDFKVAHAAQPHEKFEPSSFDLVVSSCGIHRQEREAIENAIHLLKPGGEAVLRFNELRGPFNRWDFYRKLKAAKEHFEILKLVRNGTGTLLHIKKAS
jgi:SAM-dependent methyltransferase